jgi:hypothetical protein
MLTSDSAIGPQLLIRIALLHELTAQAQSLAFSETSNSISKMSNYPSLETNSQVTQQDATTFTVNLTQPFAVAIGAVSTRCAGFGLEPEDETLG